MDIWGRVNYHSVNIGVRINALIGPTYPSSTGVMAYTFRPNRW